MANPSYLAQLNHNPNLPKKIKCNMCNKMKAPDNYSNKQLSEYIANLKRKASNVASLPTCATCQPKQNTEMRCFMCGKVEALDQFSKAQRKTPDHAKCLDCMEQQLNAEAVPDRVRLEVESDRDSDDETGTSGGVSLLGSADGITGGLASNTGFINQPRFGATSSSWQPSSRNASQTQSSEATSKKWAKIPRGPSAPPASLSTNIASTITHDSDESDHSL